MAAKTFALNLNTVIVRDVDTMYWYSSGLYCRTQISVQSVIGLQDIRIMTVQVEGDFDLHRFFYIFLEVKSWKEWKHSRTIMF